MASSSRNQKSAPDRRYFACFISLIGFALLGIVVIGTLWPEAANQADGSLIQKLMMACGLGFALVGLLVVLPIPMTLPADDSVGETRGVNDLAGQRYMRMITVLGPLMIVGAIILVLVAFHLTKLPPAEARQFALTVPLDDGSAPDIAQSAVLFWNVPGEAPHQDPGVLSMVLAAGLIMIFGLLYPKIAASNDEEAKGLVQKLVIPALGLVIFGFGAVQAAQAEESQANIRLVSQGLPPVIGLPRAGARPYILRAGEPPQSSARQLETAINELITQLRSKPNQSVDDQQLINQVANIRSEIHEGDVIEDRTRRRESRRLQLAIENGFFSARQSLSELDQHMAALHGDTGAMFAQLQQQDRATLCAIVQAQSEDAAQRRAAAIEGLRQRQRQDAENILHRAWWGMIGRSRDQQSADLATLSATLGNRESFDAIHERCSRLVSG
jgi:hypothetical protein